jgi:magnesium-transporting ATPase (P-type)
MGKAFAKGKSSLKFFGGELRTVWKSACSFVLLFQVGCVCNNAVINGDTLLGQPTEGALLAAGMKVLSVLLNTNCAVVCFTKQILKIGGFLKFSNFM